MRTWALAVAALTLVALTSPIAAGDKRSSALAVRVTVVRPCSVNTDAGLQANPVTCGSRFGPPVRSTSSTITLQVPTAPAARMVTTALNTAALNNTASSDTAQNNTAQNNTAQSNTALSNTAAPREPSRDQSDAPAARNADASAEQVVDASAAVPAENAAADSADPDAATAPATVDIRVVTVNF